jgi:hypothetical protein
MSPYILLATLGFGLNSVVDDWLLSDLEPSIRSLIQGLLHIGLVGVVFLLCTQLDASDSDLLTHFAPTRRWRDITGAIFVTLCLAGIVTRMRELPTATAALEVATLIAAVVAGSSVGAYARGLRRRP